MTQPPHEPTAGPSPVPGPPNTPSFSPDRSAFSADPRAFLPDPDIEYVVSDGSASGRYGWGQPQQTGPSAGPTIAGPPADGRSFAGDPSAGPPFGGGSSAGSPLPGPPTAGLPFAGPAQGAPGASLYGPPPGGPPPVGAGPAPRRTPIGVLIALAAVVVIAIGTSVILLNRDDDRPGALAVPSAAPSASGTQAAKPGTVSGPPGSEQISDLLVAIGAQTKGALLNKLTIRHDGSARFTVCDGDDAVTHYEVDSKGDTTDDGNDDQPCSAGFKTSDLDPDSLAAIAKQHADEEDEVELVVDSWNTYTPSVSVEVDGEFTAEYDLAGNELDFPIDPTEEGDRATALAAIEEASGITEVAVMCVDIEFEMVAVIGDGQTGLETWQFTNLAQRIDSPDAPLDGRMNLADHDIGQQVELSDGFADKYEADGSEFAMVCLDATFSPGEVVASFYYSKGIDEQEYSHQLVTTLDGSDVLYED